MEIKLSRDEFKIAVLDYVRDRYEFNIKDDEASDELWINLYKPNYTYLKDKNGEIKKCKNGYMQIDHGKTRYEKDSHELNELDEICIVI